jgi:CBS domain-containing protein/mannitol/fructose-specific phosphotransferase system IIA component (Ntr-type)
MRLTDYLRPEHIVVPLEADTVRAAVQALVRRLTETGAVAHPERLERLTSEERVRDVIHVGDRVLLPHARTDAVERLVVALGILPEPLRGPAAGAQGTEQVVVLVLAPQEAASQYLQLVAALARLLRSEAAVDRLVAARSPEEVLSIPELQELTLQPRLTVRDVMNPRAYRVYPDTPVQELVELMTRHGLRAVPVVGEKHEVLGMVTERDLLRHLHPRILRAGGGPAPEEPAEPSVRNALVRDIMSRSVLCISEDQSLSDVVSLMLNKDVERFPVVSEGRLIGSLTRSDILRKLFAS